jgi:polysaccharide export outer membrane protein
MRNATLLLFIASVLTLSSCITNRKVLFLRHDSDLKKKQPDDTLLRSYKLEDFNYKIQTNDILSIRYQSLTAKEFDFLGQNQQNSNTGLAGANTGPLLIGELVDEKGEIPIPVVGKVKVAGLTIFQIQDTIQQLANRYLEGPVVKVRLINYRATLLGELNKEGAVTFNNNRVSLMEAIGLAGGFTDLADRGNVKLIRQTGSKTDVYYIDLLKEDYLTSPYYYVYQNDLIIVPPLKQRPFRKYFLQNLSLALSVASFILVFYSIYHK